MTNLIIELSKYAFIILIALYTFLSFSVLKKRDQEEIDHGWRMQNFLTFLIHLLAYAVIYLKTGQLKFLVFYLLQFVLLQAVLVLTRVIYPMINQLVLNNMCFLLAVGFIILTRLNYDKAVRQFQMAAISLIFAMVIPVLVRKCLFLQNIPWIYGGAGLVILAAVAVFGDTTSGAKLSLNIGPVALQPSEFIKISFVFFVAARLAKSTVFKEVVLTTILAALHVIVLVLSKDLGGALLFFVTYLVMLYVATRKKIYFLAGMGAGCLAAYVAYFLFSHVRVRVLAWSNPFSVIDNEGYQITQSLFAIGTGRWFGMGLCQGSPNKIPVVDQDFAFSAIAEELGGIFAICLILICMSCFIMFVNIAMQIKNNFYKYTALGLGTMYGFQVFLTIGGAVKFIPSTGVTLPLISYGGSSLVSTIAMFAIIQGMYLLKEDEELKIEKERRAKKAKLAKARSKKIKTEKEKPE
ncbi:MAG: FtsW/RodA/SpoVE family cell cycle protein [Lachnospiraceae bacterium]|jgi:cell division protein FtsW (lipid II flippase)|nr:FtsW/RodA/SpoVE family cell cycle protein [Lachnospiraceae bacterium]